LVRMMVSLILAPFEGTAGARTDCSGESLTGDEPSQASSLQRHFKR
jgi:hypothetical protein